jgi:hypothetical protein
VYDGRRQRRDRRNLICLREFLLSAAQGLFCSSSLLDIDEQTIPANDLTIAIAERLDKRLEPSKDAIKSPSAELHGVGLSRGKVPRSSTEDGISLVRMKRVRPSPGAKLCHGQPEEVCNPAVRILKIPIGRLRVDEPRNVLEGEA